MFSQKEKIKSALEITEMVQYVLNSAVKESSDKTTSGLPIAGLNHSIRQIKNILNDAVHSYDSDASNIRDEYTAIDNEKTQKPSKGNSLASRIRPVPEEVRGRVRELVDLMESEDIIEEPV